MSDWEDLEEECTDYLNAKYGAYANFDHKGKKDSSSSDIEVTAYNGQHFWIEVKSSSSQCGQFVLLPENGHFVFSKNNKSNENQYTQKIIAFMDNNFNAFANAGTSGKDIDLPKEVFYGWINQYYKQKGIRFFITKQNDYIIFPLDKLEEYFDVTACYRIKTSGSSNPSSAFFDEIKMAANDKEASIWKDSDHTLIRTTQNLDGEKIKGIFHTFQFRRISNDIYRVTKLSNTKNANVIFSIELKQDQQKDDIDRFEEVLEFTS